MADDSVPPPVDPNQDVEEAEAAGDDEEIEDVLRETRADDSEFSNHSRAAVTFCETKMHGKMAPIFFKVDIQFRWIEFHCGCRGFVSSAPGTSPKWADIFLGLWRRMISQENPGDFNWKFQSDNRFDVGGGFKCFLYSLLLEKMIQFY